MPADVVAAPAQAGVVVPQDVAALGYQQMELRKRIALQMMAQKRRSGYPKNIGEGLTYLGESMGDVGMMAMLQRQEEERQAAETKAMQERLAAGSV